MEAELEAKFPDSKIKLVEGSGGVFDVECDGKLIYSKHSIEGQRFPEAGEISRLITQHH